MNSEYTPNAANGNTLSWGCVWLYHCSGAVK